MTATKARRGIVSYAKQREELLDVIRAHGGRLHQNDFDVEFRNRRFHKTIAGFGDDTFIILGRGWQAWLELLQCMIAAEEADQEGRTPNIIYKLPEPS